ncbi:uncharacterized protein [Penaeus vannamei]|uniref:uncharacterized protein n=1 Tax=Penaeus vannamei TaxID=6689 RepID=UPI00387FA83A
MSSFRDVFDSFEDFNYAPSPRPFALGDFFLILTAVVFFLVVCDIASLLTIVSDVGENVRLGAVFGRAFDSFAHLVEDNATARSLDALRPVLTAIGHGILKFERAETAYLFRK